MEALSPPPGLQRSPSESCRLPKARRSGLRGLMPCVSLASSEVVKFAGNWFGQVL